jgi:UDP-N-acetylglucosamine transferase subunit ALG13
MILVTIGTNEQPFDRLIRAAARLEGDEPLLVQHGSSREAHGRGEWVDFIPFDELSDRVREARVVICHAGVGSIMLARRCGHRPVVMPRRFELGEAVDDHQLHLARRLHQAGLVTLVENEHELAIATAGPGDVASAASDLKGSAALTTELRTFLGTLVRPTMALATTAGTPAKEV